MVQHLRRVTREQKHWVRTRNKATYKEELKNKSWTNVIKRRKGDIRALLSVWTERRGLMFEMIMIPPRNQNSQLPKS